MKSLAIIPARSGSKGLIDKNITDLNGHPLIYYTIKAAIESQCFDKVMVSTDSKRYADIAHEHGAEVPFLRGVLNSTDIAGSWDVVREVLSEYKRMGESFTHVALLQPTSPLRDKNDIINSFKLLEQANSVVSIAEVDHPVQWCFRLDETMSLSKFADSPYNNCRRQELEVYYHENGAIYIVDAKKIMDTNYNMYADNCLAYVMERDKSIDIDSSIDLRIASVILERNKI